MVDEKTIKEYAADTAMYYESAHGFVPAQFEKYLRKAVRKGEELTIEAYEELRKVTLRRMTELETENEELRKVAEHQQTTNMNRYFRNKALTAQFTRARELLKDFLLIAKVEQLRDKYETVSEAEQFLGEAM